MSSRRLRIPLLLLKTNTTWCCGRLREISGDENLSPRLCGFLSAEEDTAQHVHEVIGSGASDHEVMQHAIDRGAVIITADTDFGALLLEGGRTEPSVILVREIHPCRSRAKANCLRPTLIRFVRS